MMDRKKFYKTASWRKIAEQVKVRDGYVCQRCLLLHLLGRKSRVGKAEEVHHINELRDGDDYWSKSSGWNLVSLCHDCHNHITAVSHGAVFVKRVEFGPNGEIRKIDDPEGPVIEDKLFYGSSRLPDIRDAIDMAKVRKKAADIIAALEREDIEK